MVSPPVDFVILTVLEVELQALLRHLPGHSPVPPDGSLLTSYLADIPIATGGSYRVVVARLAGPGPLQAVSTTIEVVKRWQPRHVLVVGVAGGLRSRGVNLGDVIVATQIADYVRGKVDTGGQRAERWETHSVDLLLLAKAQAFSIDWAPSLMEPRPEAGASSVWFGNVASGPDVIYSADLISRFEKIMRRLLAVEMEGAGIAVGLSHALDAPRFLMIRGIADFADAPKREGWRDYAAEAAAAYTVAFLKSGPVESRHGAKPSFLTQIRTLDVGPAPEMQFDFAPRMNLFTGDNGLGKTFLLDVAWWVLTGSWPNLPASPRRAPGVTPTIEFRLGHGPAGTGRTGRFDFGFQQWTLPEAPPMRSRSIVLYARVDGGFSIWDPLRVDVLPFETGLHLWPTAVWDGAEDEAQSTVLCNGLLRDWVSWQLQRSEAFDLLTRALEGLSPHPGETLRPGAEPIRLSLRDARDIPTIQLPYGTVPVVHASAGMKRILSLAYVLVWTWREHLEAARLKNTTASGSMIILFDEVESHLHPTWQRVILPSLFRVLKDLASSLEIQLFATTHAPLVLASVEPLFDETRDALFLFDLVEREVEVSRLAWMPKGDASSWLTSPVFGLAQARSVEAEEAIEEARAAMKAPDLPLDEVRRIHHQLQAVLKETDPFWPRWLARAQQAGIEP